MEFDRVYDRYREILNHEDDLIAHRTNWLLGVQGLITLAAAEVISAAEPVRSLFLFVLGVIGGTSAWAVHSSVRAAQHVWRRRRAELSKAFEMAGEDGSVIEKLCFPELNREDGEGREGERAALWLPIAFLCAWTGLLLFLGSQYLVGALR